MDSNGQSHATLRLACNRVIAHFMPVRQRSFSFRLPTIPSIVLGHASHTSNNFTLYPKSTPLISVLSFKTHFRSKYTEMATASCSRADYLIETTLRE